MSDVRDDSIIIGKATGRSMEICEEEVTAFLR
jgi:hypothetical protein